MPDTYVSPAAGEQLLIQFGDGADPEVFTASCTINTTRSLKRSASASTTELADCTNPSNPAQTVRAIKSVDLTFDGAGIADIPSFLAMETWLASGQPKNCKVIINLTGADGGVTYDVALVILSLDLAGTRGEKATFTAAFGQAAAPTSIALNA